MVIVRLFILNARVLHFNVIVLISRYYLKLVLVRSCYLFLEKRLDWLLFDAHLELRRQLYTDGLVVNRVFRHYISPYIVKDISCARDSGFRP